MTMNNENNYENSGAISVEVKAQYIEEQSQPEDKKYVFAYTIRISNNGEETAKLISRFWQITDSDDRVQEVQGEGVIGEQPVLTPGQSYTYTSGAVIETAAGTMTGHYVMQLDNGEQFQTPIPTFALVQPQALH